MILLLIVAILFMLYWVGWYAILMWLIGTAVVCTVLLIKTYQTITESMSSMIGKIAVFVILLGVYGCIWLLVGALPL